MGNDYMVCPKCGKEHPMGARFCRECGAELQIRKEASSSSCEPPKAQASKADPPAGHSAEKPESGLFANVGKRLKLLCKIGFYIASVPSAVFGIFFLNQALETEYMFKTYFIIGLVLLIAVPFFIWEAALFIYGYAETIDRVTTIERLLKEGK